MSWSVFLAHSFFIFVSISFSLCFILVSFFLFYSPYSSETHNRWLPLLDSASAGGPFLLKGSSSCFSCLQFCCWGFLFYIVCIWSGDGRAGSARVEGAKIFVGADQQGRCSSISARPLMCQIQC